MKKIISLLLILVFMLGVLVSCNKDKDDDEIEGSTNYVCIDVEEFGKIYVELSPDSAPKTVKNFQKLVSQKFYDGLTFHRVIEDFMIQGGVPKGNGSGGNTDKDGNEINVDGEFKHNGYDNPILHERGVISMARSASNYESYLHYGYTMDDFSAEARIEMTQAFNSASSQFFIVHKTSEHLDGFYTAFGWVVNGMDVVDAIATVDTNSNDAPIEKVVINSITFVEKSDIPE